MPRILYVTIIALIMSLCLISCSDSTSSEKGKLTGKITLDGQTDASGITISIYITEVVPEKVLGINHEYPQVAFPVTDQVYFDHRSYTPIATTTTNQEGVFELTGLPYDKYIITYRKEGWGYNYLYDIVLNKSELDISTLDEMKLYPEQVIPSYIDGAYTFETGKCYVANSNVIFGENAIIEMQNNTRLLLGQNVKITSHGALTLPAGDHWAHITSLTGTYTGIVSPTQLAEGLSIQGGASSVHNISFSFLSNALMIASANVDIIKTSYRSCVFGLIANSTSDLSVSTSLFINNQDVNGSASYFYDVTGVSNNKCLFYGNYMALKHELVKDAVVENNAFIDNNRGFLNLWESVAVFKHNNINSEGVGVENSGGSNLEVSYNTFDTKICISTFHTSNWGDTLNAGWTKANNNNLNATEYAVSCRAIYYYQGNPMPLDFSQNYWGTSVLENIEDLILDYNDLPPCDSTSGGNWGLVEYVPYKTSKLINAGIQ